MPTYEYACRTCGEHLEVVQGFNEDALTECPACHGPLRKVFGNIGIAFKGSGFYKNDSRSSATGSKSRSGEGGDTKTETKTESTSDTKTDSKSDTKSDSKTDSKSTTDTKSDKPRGDTKAKSSGSDKAAAS